MQGEWAGLDSFRRYWLLPALGLALALGWWHGARRSPGPAGPGGPAPAAAAVPAMAPAWTPPAAGTAPGAPAAVNRHTPATARSGGPAPVTRSGRARGEGAPPRVHVIQDGETAWGIAQRYGLTLASLAAANPEITDLSYLRAGDELKLPPGAAASAGEAGEPDPAVLAALARSGALIWPVKGEVSDAFGYRNHPITGRISFHSGLDIAANHGDEIRAARAGVVTYAGWMGGYGRTVILDHPDGSRTLYAHASRVLVKEGETVPQGKVIALVGSTGNSTGPHLHFELIVGRPVDPARYLPRAVGRP